MGEVLDMLHIYVSEVCAMQKTFLPPSPGRIASCRAVEKTHASNSVTGCLGETGVWEKTTGAPHDIFGQSAYLGW